MAMNKTNQKPMQYPKEQRIPRWKQWADKKIPQFRLKKTPPERELSLNEMPNELRLYVLEHPQRDEADVGISNLVFDVNNKERPPWPRSEVIFFVQVSIIVLMIILCSFFYQKAVKRNQFGLLPYRV